MYLNSRPEKVLKTPFFRESSFREAVSLPSPVFYR